MSKEKNIKRKSNKKAPVKNLKEKRAAKAAKRKEKKNESNFQPHKQREKASNAFFFENSLLKYPTI